MISTVLWAALLALSLAHIDGNERAADSGSDSDLIVVGTNCVADGEGKDPLSCGYSRRLGALIDSELPDGEPRGGSPAEPEDATDVLHYFLDIKIIPEYSGPTPTAVRVEGVNTILVQSAVDGLTTFTVDLNSSLTLNGITGNVASYVRVGDQIIITLDHAYNTNEQFQVAVDYSGYPSTAGFGAFAWWTRNDAVVVATLSEPYYARTWWACKDRLNDKSTMQIHCTVPNPLVVASNGVDEGTEAMAGGRTKYKWNSTNPIAAYLACLSITTYKKYDLVYNFDAGFGPQVMPVVSYLYSDHWDNGLNLPTAAEKAGCDELPTMLEKLGIAFGLYPFLNEKYGVAETGGVGSAFSGTSMEHQTITSMSQIANFSDIMAHELAHHWWGDNVTCGTWNDIWLNEGFASYSEAVYRELKPGGGVASYWARMNARRPSTPEAQTYRTNIDSVGAIFSTNSVYNKGAWALHMLRHVMGDALFFQALLNYRASHESGFATTDEFAASISGTFGHDLSWFTDQWIMNPGAPRYEWAVSTSILNSQTYLKLMIRQTQNAQGFGVITMPVDIRITTNSGVTVTKVWNDSLQEYYVIPVDGLPSLVEFDEDGGINNRNWILTKSLAQVAGPVAGPPVILEATISPFGLSAGESRVELTFSENIGSFDAADLSLIGDATGVHAPFSITYSAVQQKATMVFSQLPNDSYLLTILDDAIVANSQLLDGEIDDSAWYDTSLLPSGDGQAGGDAVFAFSLLAGDSNCDGIVSLSDVAPFVSVALGDDVNICHFLRSDLNNNGAVNGSDVELFVTAILAN